MFSFYDKVKKHECIEANVTEILFQDLYAGIPDTLLLNVVSTLILVMLYTIVRNKSGILRRDKIKKRWSLMFNSTLTKVSDVASQHKAIMAKQRQTNLGSFNWIIETIKLNKDSILKHCGPDALFYLSFQKHLLFVMGVMTFVSIFIALPVNLQGTIYKNTTNFGRTTLSNLQPESDLLWVHVIISVLYIPLFGITMKNATIPKNFLTVPSRAIMITNISRNVRDKTIIRNHIRELFPNVTIEDIQLAYDIKKLISTYDEYEKVVLARTYCERNQTNDKPIYMRSFCSCKKFNAYEYYSNREIKLASKLAQLKESFLNFPLGIAFVTLSKASDAQHIVSKFRSRSDKNWKISLAPTSYDINWENLNVSPNKWYLKWYLANICLFFVLFFITTPAIVVNILNLLILTKTLEEIEECSSVISHFLPTMILLMLKIMMPILVTLSETYLYHWTKSLEELAIMTKTFGYLLFMTLILPSLGLTSVQGFVEWTIESAIKETTEYRWKCVFLPHKGAFFVNYVITSAFIGNLLDLIRFPDLVWYGCQKLISKSVAETPYIRKTVFVQFPFGVHYAWILLIFSICAVYSLVVPLITPFGIIYIMLKYFCDKHNLYFMYGSTNMIDKSAEMIHKTASTLTNFSVVMVLTLLSAFITMRAQVLDSKSIFLMLIIFITLMLFMFMTIFSQYVKKTITEEKIAPTPSYIPKVLHE